MCILSFANIASFFSIIAAIATALYAYIAYNTLQEIKNQRETTYIPEVILQNFQFFIYSIVKEDLPNPCSFTEIDKGEFFEVTIPYEQPYLKLHNIGLGTAKYIIANYSFDIDATLKLIETANSKLPDELKISINRQEKHFEFKPNSDNLPIKNMIIPNIDREYTLNHILPASIMKEATNIMMFPLYFQFISLSIYYMYAVAMQHEGENRILDFIKLPPLIMKLHYSDIANKAHSKTFEIRFSISRASLIKSVGVFDINEIEDAA